MHCHWLLAPNPNGLSTCPSRYPACWAMPIRNSTLSCLLWGACTQTIFSMNCWLGLQMLIGRDYILDVPLCLLHRGCSLTGYPCSTMDWLQMEYGVLAEHIWSQSLYSPDYHQADENGPAQSIMGKAHPLEDRCWLFSVVHAQMGPRSYIDLWVRRSRTNWLRYYSDMPHKSGTDKNAWSDSFGWWDALLLKCHQS